MVNQQGISSLKETDAPSLSGHELSVTPHLDMRAHVLCFHWSCFLKWGMPYNGSFNLTYHHRGHWIIWTSSVLRTKAAPSPLVLCNAFHRPSWIWHLCFFSYYRLCLKLSTSCRLERVGILRYMHSVQATFPNFYNLFLWPENEKWMCLPFKSEMLIKWSE